MMESTAESCSMAMSAAAASPQLPPGFRFHPTDEELLIHYLRKRAASVPLPVPIIADIDLYKFDPWELPGMASFGEHEWYFFSQRDRKYPNGARPNRAATSGYWKATGTDKPVMTSQVDGRGREKLGVKKALVFYGGKPPKGIKTNWIMHEYRLSASAAAASTRNSNSRPNSYCFDSNKKPAAPSLSLRLDDWVLCRIYHKNNPPCRLLLPPDNVIRRDHDDDSVINTPSLHLPAGLGLSSGLCDGGGGGGGQLITRLQQQFPMKRTFPFLYWSNETAPGVIKRFHHDHDHDQDQNNNTGEGEEEADETSTSMAITLQQQQLYQLHQQQQVNIHKRSPSSSLIISHHQQPMLGDGGGLRHPPAFQLPGVNWGYTLNN